MSAWNASDIREVFSGLEDNYVVRNIVSGMSSVWRDNLAKAGLIFLLLLYTMAIVGPMIIPYEYDAVQYDEGGDIKRAEPPSLQHPLGTTYLGYDVLSRLLYGARPTAYTGIVAGTMLLTIGLTVGLVSGYVGGVVEEILMRITDFVYSVPLLPAAIVLVGMLGISFSASVVVIGAILWRSPARVVRSQVIQVKERPFVLASKASGASNVRIMVRHILPNVLPMALIFFARGLGYAVIVQAGLAFLGVTTPFVPSWGIMVRNAYNSGVMAQSVWWAIPPGLLISLTVLSAYMIARGSETTAEEEQIFAEAG
jgi:peptide/nickel transport system permease protein